MSASDFLRSQGWQAKGDRWCHRSFPGVEYETEPALLQAGLFLMARLDRLENA